MGAVIRAFYDAVLHGVGAPLTVENERACFAWQAAEGGSARFNPFNTTQPEPGATHYNSFGPGGVYHVMSYPDSVTGVRATVATLRNGHYGGIVAALHRGGSGLAVCEAVDASVWGTHGAARVYRIRYGAPAPHPVPRLLYVTGSDPRRWLRGSDVRQVQEALIGHGFGHLLGRDGADSVFGPASARATEAFQREVMLVVDGKVGPRTRHALGLG